MEIFHRNFRTNGKRSKFGENRKRKRKTDKVVKFSLVNEKHLLIWFLFFRIMSILIKKMQLNDKTVPRAFKFLLSMWEVSKVNVLIEQTQLLANPHSLFIPFLTDKAFSSCLWAFFFINSNFNFGPGVIAYTAGVIFSRFSAGEGKCSLRRARKYVCWGPMEGKNNDLFSDRTTPPPHLGVWMTRRPLSYLKVWIRHC